MIEQQPLESSDVPEWKRQSIERSLRSIYEEEPQPAVTSIGADHRDLHRFIARASSVHAE